MSSSSSPSLLLSSSSISYSSSSSSTSAANIPPNSTTLLTTNHIQLSPLTQVYHIIMSVCGYELPNLSLLLHISTGSLPVTYPPQVHSEGTTTISASNSSNALELLRVNICVPCNAIVLMNRCWNILCHPNTGHGTDTNLSSSSSSSSLSLSYHSIAIACLHLACKIHDHSIKLSRILSIYKQHACHYYSSVGSLPSLVVPGGDNVVQDSSVSFSSLSSSVPSSSSSSSSSITTLASLHIADLYVIGEIEYYILNIWLHLPYQSPSSILPLTLLSSSSSSSSPPSTVPLTVSSPYVTHYLRYYHHHLLGLPIVRGVSLHYPFEVIERQLLYLSSRFIQRFSLVMVSATTTDTTTSPPLPSSFFPLSASTSPDLTDNVGYQYSILLSTVVYPLSCLAYVYLPDIISDLVTVPYTVGKNTIINNNTIDSKNSSSAALSSSMITSGEVYFAIAALYASVYRICNEPTDSLDTESKDTLLFPVSKEYRLLWEEVYQWLLEFPFVWNELFNHPHPRSSPSLSSDNTNDENYRHPKITAIDGTLNPFVTLVQELKILVQYIQ